MEKNIILEGPKKARCHTCRLNYAAGYKGDGFKALDGGKASPRPAEAPSGE